MDLIELTAYGNVQRAPTSSGCRIQWSVEDLLMDLKMMSFSIFTWSRIC